MGAMTLTYKRKTQTIPQWARQLNISPLTIYGRVKQKLPVRKILSKQNLGARMLTLRGKTCSVTEWAEYLGIPVSRILGRLRAKWPMKKVLSRGNYALDSSLTWDGRTQTPKEWAKETGINVETIYNRMQKGWPPEKILSKTNYNAKMITHNGKTQSCAEWSRETGVGIPTIYYRINKGWPLERVLNPDKETGPNMVTHNGDTLCVAGWARKVGVHEATLYHRLFKLGWSLEEALTKNPQRSNTEVKFPYKGKMLTVNELTKFKKAGISRGTLHDRLRRGMCAEEALTKPRHEKPAKKPNPDGTFTCQVCGKKKDKSEFGKHPDAKYGINIHCKGCARLKRHGISYREFERRRKAQSGLCLICRKEPTNSRYGKKLVIDHDHDGGFLRGLLCFTCNSAIGGLQEDPTTFIRALAYLLKAKEKQGIVMLEDLGEIDRQIPLIINILCKKKTVPVI